MVGVITTRPMHHDDITSALAIEASTYPTPWSAGIFRDELGAPGRNYVVAEIGGELVGYAGLLLIGDEGHITSVTVHPQHRSKGIGTILMLSLAESAIEAGARSLTLEVRVSNRSAQALYQRFGMAPVGVRKAYYRDEDALIMWVHDVDRPEFRERLTSIREHLR
jgi:ribosomal-protein-alanine N-acetyltransferase